MTKQVVNVSSECVDWTCVLGLTGDGAPSCFSRYSQPSLLWPALSLSQADYRKSTCQFTWLEYTHEGLDHFNLSQRAGSFLSDYNKH